MGWHGVANAISGQQDATILPTLGIVYCYAIFVVKEISTEILVGQHTNKFNLSLQTQCQFDCDIMKYEKSSQILYHVIPPGLFCNH